MFSLLKFFFFFFSKSVVQVLMIPVLKNTFTVICIREELESGDLSTNSRLQFYYTNEVLFHLP